MKVNYIDIMLAFWQQGSNNCVSIALIKAAIEVFGLNSVFESKFIDGQYEIRLKNGLQVRFTEQQFQDSVRLANFQISKDKNQLKQPVYLEILNYAKLCYAVMVATYAYLESDKENKMSFGTALERLNNGTNSNYVAKYLGLEHFVTKPGLRSPKDAGMYAWFRNHTVYMSHNVCDVYGNIKRNTLKYPKKIQIHDKPIVVNNLMEEEVFSELNYINISKYGTFHETGHHHTTPEQVDNILRYIKNQKKDKLLIYFHGGLVSEQSGMDGAKQFFKDFSGDPDTHIVSIIWETGLLESLPQTISRMFGDSLFQKLLHKVAKYFEKKSGLEKVEKAFKDNKVEESVFDFAVHFANNSLLNDDGVLYSFYEQEFVDAAPDETNIRNEMEQLMADEELTETELEALGQLEETEGFLPNPKLLFFAAKIVHRCILRFAKKRDHGVWPTIVEEVAREIKVDFLGSEIWTTMKDQAHDMWISNKGITDINRFAGRYMMDRIIKFFPENDLKIDVVGHSAGSIAVCEWIKAINDDDIYRSFQFQSAVFLAPACRCELFHESILKYPATVKRFRMFTLSDYYESNDKLASILYPRSLLYLISGVLEGTKSEDVDAYILGLHRHIRLLPPYHNNQILKDIHHFLFLPDADSCNLILSKSSGIDGRSADATGHSGFTFNKEVINSMKHFLKESPLYNSVQ